MQQRPSCTKTSALVFAILAVVIAAATGQSGFAQSEGATTPSPGISDNPCGGRRIFFNTFPTAGDGLRGVDPLGSLHPPSTHVFPTHHLHLFVPVADASHPDVAPLEEPLYSPGRLELVAVEYSGTHADPWDLVLKPCSEVSLLIQHLHSLDPAIAAQLSLAPAVSLGDMTVYLTHIDVTSGRPLGTVGIGTLGWDMGLIDRRQPPLPFANPDRYALSDAFLGTFPPDLVPVVSLVAPQRLYQFCPFDYFVPPVRRVLESFLGSFDGSVRRTAAPICGEHMQDIAGTAQGNWFKNTTDIVFFDEGNGVGLVHDNVDPARPAFSVGFSFPNWTPEVRYFVPVGAGRVNREFSDVIPGAIYCYEHLSLRFGAESGSVLVQVFSSGSHPVDRIRIERRPSIDTCGAGPYLFGADAVVFQR